MNIYAKKGDKVIYSKPKAGYPIDQELGEKHLTLNKIYTIDYTNVENWSTTVYLQEFNGIAFNSVLFEDYKEELNMKKYPEINGIYQHYKGGKYKVITLAKHSETNEELVIYQSIPWGSIHARPLNMWFDLINNITERFKLITNE